MQLLISTFQRLVKVGNFDCRCHSCFVQSLCSRSFHDFTGFTATLHPSRDVAPRSIDSRARIVASSQRCVGHESGGGRALPFPFLLFGGDALNEGGGCYSPSSYKQKKLSKSKAEEHSHPKGPPTGEILFHNFIETDLWVVTTTDFFSQNVADFHY